MILASPATNRPLTALLARISAALPRGWSDLGRQLAIFAVFDLFYELSRILAAGDRSVAMAHANDIVSTERSLGIFSELDVQQWALSAPGIVQTIANWTYFNCQFTISFGFLFWVYLKRNDAYAVVRNTLMTAMALGLVGYMLYPAAPPRMLTELGFVDTLNSTSVNHNSGLIASLSNPYAAMPSMHTAFALIIGFAGVMLVRSRVLRVMWAFYPALVIFSIIATGNHFFLDAAGGAGVAIIAALAVHAIRTRSRNLAVALAAAPVASFLVYRFAGQARDVADALGAVAVGTLVLALAANLVSVWLKAAVWQRAVNAVPGTPKMRTQHLLPSVFIGFLFNTVLVARLGEVARVAVLRRKFRADGTDVGAAAIAGTLVAEQIILGAALVLIGAVLALTIVTLPGWAISTLFVLGALTIGAVIAGFLARRSRLSLPSGLQRLARPATQMLDHGLRVLHSPREATIAIALGVGSWGAQIAGIYWTLDAFGMPNTAAAAAAVFLVSTLVGLFPLMPGNVGVFQIAVAGVLASSFGVNPAAGAAFAIGLQATEVALGAGIGALYLLAEGVSFADLRRESSAPVANVIPLERDERAFAVAA
ncbi:MAG: hypothetical protein QOJ13_1261 [Gaiellales bacterium]|jgi:uncharacterized protein (TIRG00374 family)|nr:hypothetical protein [Gaiellales bacterium]MDX6592065.1 hypothetical protein [Gaiellales bacterium]